MTPLGVPPDLSLNGIDGLALSGASLIAIQNGVLPHRVIRLDLAADGLTISRGRILEMNHPDFDEPTLGVVVGGALYFSADSQGPLLVDVRNDYSIGLATFFRDQFRQPLIEPCIPKSE